MQNVQALFAQLEEDAQANNHRRMLVLSGEQTWCHQQISFLCSHESLVWIGSAAPVDVKPTPNQRCHKLLGRTISHVVYDAWQGLNPNSFGQISGCLSGGGIFVLLCPDLDKWPEFDDPEHHNLVAYPHQPSDSGRRFISRFAHLLEDDGYSLIIRQSDENMGMQCEVPPGKKVEYAQEAVLPSKTVDQQHAVELILSQFRRGRRPVVITADRGRGKSVALGIAAAQLSGLDYENILVTAPDYQATDAAFAIAHQLLPEYRYEKGILEDRNHSIRFLEPDMALLEAGEGQVLLVDEAASIPVPVLTRLLKKFPRIAFSSTIHGYEGTGQGFNVRFKAVLEREAPNTKSIHLHQPIRWAAEDPLERLVFNLLMLNADAVDEDRLADGVDDDVSIIRVNRDDLIEDYSMLGQLFGLLVLAHYRTTPGDLRVLLDSPNLHIWMILRSDNVLGVALVAEEGPLQTELVDDIWSGQRRPRGHLLPQTLVAQEGYKPAASLRYGRVMRIAVHPSLQRSQLGSQLLERIKQDLASEGMDCLGSSFSASSDLLNFWQLNGFEMVRLGSARDHISGSHAGLVLCSLSADGRLTHEHLRARFLEQLNYRFSDDLVDLDPELICMLLKHAGHLPEMLPHDWDDLTAFAQHNRSYESCAFAIHKFTFYFLDWVDNATLKAFLLNPDFTLLVQRNLQQKSWPTLEKDGQGRRQMVVQLRNIIRLMLELNQNK